MGSASIVAGSGILDNTAATTTTTGNINTITLAGCFITSASSGSIHGGNIAGWGNITSEASLGFEDRLL